MSTEFIGENSITYVLEQRLAQGGQGTIYKAKSTQDGSLHAIKWYHVRHASESQRQQLQALTNYGAPRTNVDGIEFIWPRGMVGLPSHPGYGYAMPLYDTERFVHLNRVINGKRKQPSQDVLCRLSYLVCAALESVHRGGLAYCDINLGNINFDFDEGRIVVCDNDNVVVNNADVSIMGVPEFMAPEVALGKEKPNAQSDLYSIAVLLYQLWTWEHPMEGALTARIRCWDQPAKRKFYADQPLFVHHPTDRRNSADTDPMLAYSVRRWETMCPPRLKKLFTQTFTEGVHNPGKRIRLSEWQRLFLELESNAVCCPDCGARNLVDDETPKMACFHCQRPLQVNLALKVCYPGGESHLLVHTGSSLKRHHVDAHASFELGKEIIGQVEQHPSNANGHILRNQTQVTWYYIHGDKTLQIEPGRARPLLPGGQIRIDNVRIQIERL